MGHWELELREKGFPGVTFCKRSDVRYGVRPIPYYEIDGPIELLQDIKNHLFKYGINATLTKTKYFNSLQIIGMRNCIILAEVLELNDIWTNSLHNDFVQGKHRTPAGIKHLFNTFGAKSLLSYDEVCEIVDAAKQKRLDETLFRILTKKKQLHLLPQYDPLYSDITTHNCQRCGANSPKIYFIGKYPRPGNYFYLCVKCRKAVLKD